MALNEKQKEKYLEKLFELLRIPSISTDPKHKPDIAKAVAWLAKYVEPLGFVTEQLFAKGLDEKSNNPVLFAERVDNPKNPTILIYGHYDVQPAEPLDEWVSPAFEPEVRDDNIYGRGTTDDKGQTFTHLAALSELSQDWGEKWPINVKLLIEGEEEFGGENIEALVQDSSNKEKFAADYCLVSDTGFVAEGKPTIECGLRGLAYMQIDVKLCDQDLHSGLFGGGVLNPANALSNILAQLENAETGVITIPGIYDDVVDIDDDERKNLSQIPFEDTQFLKEAGNAKAARPEKGYTVVESTAARPSLDINGMWSGFTGEGAKTIIPATAHAKVSIRTVANQDPRKVAKQFGEYVASIAPKEVDVTVTTITVGDGARIETDSTGTQLAAKALQETFGGDVIFSRCGGSIPVVACMQKHLDVDPILIGYGLPDDALHSPNEKLSLNQFYKGIECNIALYEKIANE